MVKLVVLYKCEVCGELYHSEVDATRCEGAPSDDVKYPVGSHVKIVRGVGIGQMGTIESVTIAPPNGCYGKFTHRVVYTLRVCGTSIHRVAIQGIDVV